MYSMRDWGHAKDYIRAFNMMLVDQPTPKDYVLATEQSVTVKEFAEAAFRKAGYNNIKWVGTGVNEKLHDVSDNDRVLLEIDPQFFRPGEVPYLRGSAKEAREVLGFSPKYLWPRLMADMLEYDMDLAEIESDIMKKHRSKL